MPGKYSHSVVLADYSSRGIINLPNEQHIAYLRDSPVPSSIYSRNGSRAPSLMSERAKNRTWTETTQKNGRDSSVVSFRSSAGRHIIVDPLTTSSARDQNALSQQNSNNKQLEQVFCCSNRQSQDVESKLTSPNLQNQSAKLSHRTVPPQSSDTGARSLPNKRLYRSNDAQTAQTSSTKPSALPKSAIIASPGKRTTGTQSEGKRNTAAEKHSTPTSSTLLATAVPVSKPVDVTQVQVPRRQKSSGTIDTQIFSPISPVIDLNFEGFSDGEESAASYFENATLPQQTIAPQTHIGASNLSRSLETPPPRHISRSQQSQVRTLNSVSSVPSDHCHTAGSDDFNGKVDSLTSLSSLGSWGTPSSTRMSKQADIRKATIRPLATNSPLPEIEEDGVFGPDLFSQGFEDARPVSSDLAMEGFGRRSLGMISSGRDVTEDDNESLASAACPPDIGRYRDEDDSAAAPSVQMSNTHVRRESSTARSPQSKRSGGIFSRFRPKGRHDR